MVKLSYKFVYLFVFFLVYLVRPENVTKPTSTTTTTTEKIDYINLDSAILCKFQPNGYDCDGTRKVTPKFYYDLKLEDCRTFNIGTCPHNLNAYESLSECHHACRVSRKLSHEKLIHKTFADAGTHRISRNLSVRIFCRLQPDFGYCNEYHPRWYYDVTTRRCKGFSYSGCGGNLNKFITQQSCTASCVAIGQAGF